jgi:molybdate transport system substrate-binding protein
VASHRLLLIPGERFVAACVGIALAVCLWVGGSKATAQNHEIRVAVAADFRFAMEELSAQFENTTGIKVDITTGSSGSFFAQIESGAPFDLFFSADLDYPRKLEDADFAEPGTFSEYALGRIVIWAPARGKADVSKLGWNTLLDARVRKIAIANPELAPYGRAAVSALQKAGIYAQVKTKLVYGENISQAAQFVQSGNAQAGLIALSLALSPGMKDGKMWEIPAQTYPPIEQGVVLLKSAKSKVAARTFLDFVRSAAGRQILEKHGFAIPQSK